MRRFGARDALIYVVLPFLATILFDQWAKHWALGLALDKPENFGPIELVLHHNPGFMLGSMANASQMITIVAPSTIGAFLLFVFCVVQYFLPIRSPILRSGLSVFIAG